MTYDPMGLFGLSGLANSTVLGLLLSKQRQDFVLALQQQQQQQQHLGANNVQSRQANPQAIGNSFNAPSLGAGTFGGHPGAGIPSYGPIGGYANPDDGLERKIVYGELTGWRCWHLELLQFVPGLPSTVLLKSPMYESIWDPGVPVEGEPGTISMAGVNAFKQRVSVVLYPAQWIVLGTVEMWGDVIEYEDGYRSQFALVKSINALINRTRDPDQDEMDHHLADLRSTYGSDA